eukprot:14847772-Alexandrium_andersonii.AAC.1
MRARQAKAKARNSRVCRLAKVTRKAKTLFTAGTFPQYVWGHQAQGLSPSCIRQLRAMALSALGLGTTVLCTTTALAVAYGPDADPGIRQRTELIAHWLQ